MKFLKQKEIRCLGVDFDEHCVEMSCKYGDVINSDISRVGPELPDSLNLAVFNHSLEHIQDPATILIEFKKYIKWFLISVPNPLRPNVIKFALQRRIYSNRGHFYSWDKSHLTNFLELRCGLKIVEWFIDDVICPSKIVRKLLQVLKMVDVIETNWLPQLLPFFSSSLIVLCCVPFAQKRYIK